jgi:ABC-type antimicrobial peptide transport system permease subunit
MATVWLLLRADLRHRWRALLGLALILGLVGGVVITAAAGARRTETAYPRLLAWAGATRVTVIVTNSESVLKPPPGQPADQYFTAGGKAAEAVRRQYFAALGRLPGVASVTLATEYNMALPAADGAGPDTGVQVFASRDGSLGVSGDRVKITAGRMFDPSAAGAAVIDQALASRLGLRPGGTLRLLGIRKDSSGTADLKLAVPLAFRVTGIGQFDDQVVPATATTAQPRVLLSAPFAATDLAVAMTNLPEAAVRLRPGASVTAFLRAADVLRARYGIDGGHYATVTRDDENAATERAIRPQALALAVFAALAGLIGLAVTGQLLARQLALDAGDFPALRAIGATRGRLTAEALGRLLAVTVPGGAVAVVIAVAASPLMPIGPARLAEPAPGVAVDLPVLAAGFAAVALLPVAALAPSAWRAVRRTTEAGGLTGGRGAAAPARASRLAGLFGHAGWVTSATGMRMAFEPGRGRTAVPVRTALAGTAVAVGAVTAALVFAASLFGLVATPARYGQNWDAKVDAGYADIPASYGARLLAGVPGIAGYAAGNNGELTVDGMSVPAIGVDRMRDDGPAAGYLTLLSGRPPSGTGQIALGTRTLRALGKHVGQTVRVQVTWRGGDAGPPAIRTMRITGTAVFPAFGLPPFASTDLGSGAVVATSLLSGTTPDTGCTGGQTCYNFLLLRLRPGTSASGTAATLLARAAQAHCPPGQCTVTTDQRPGDIKDYAGIRDTPLVLGAVLVLLAVGTLAHVLLTGVRRRRRDLAVLRALGLTRRQVQAVVAWNATALAAAALLIGVPLGIVAGRWAWAVFADAAGVAAAATVDVPLVLLVIPATVVLANVIAAWPGRAAARLRPAVVLHTE